MGRDGSGKTRLGNGILPRVDACSPQNRPLVWQTWWPSKGDRLLVTDLNGATVAILLDDTVYVYQPTWSPAGTQVAYIAGPRVEYAPQVGDTCDVWVVNADGSGRRRLTTTAAPDQFIRGSPDGDELTNQEKQRLSRFARAGRR